MVITGGKNSNRKCPKCSSDMIKHESMLSMPLTSSEPQSTADTTKKNMNIEDQDANFTFRFHSCSKCGYTELYLHGKGKRV
jgi:predicted nucleic-acid-binding Zn-ribbon protein